MSELIDLPLPLQSHISQTIKSENTIYPEGAYISSAMEYNGFTYPEQILF